MRKKILSLALLSLAACSSGVSAATINYGSAFNIVDQNSVDTSFGTIEYAYNFSLEETTTDVNGVTFTGIHLDGINSSPDGNISYITGGSTSDASATIPGGTNAGLATLLGGGTFTGGNASAEITLNNLTIGNKYQVQLFSFQTNSGEQFSVDGNLLDPQSGTLGQTIIGTFTADAETQTINTSGSQQFAVGNGLVLVRVPEQSSFAVVAGLLTVSIVVFTRRRRS
ncbi:hypothetical protein [Rubellicoccus peritrichatus]|uniref:PEP-CTERM protein-sorting domain-containing protein n=1 Tax=Rubellicoccus peritrichatus TaxID=3080537 RepID=A0AAQ3QQU2_9BACT|nr:hypothetical protein [Puniceicoccus sp. CR14]WOO40613.1 hypothetical protein RZN69_18480 [Puniceicoccus sp. CR14]